MDVIKTKNITNSKQFEKLVCLMETNVELAKGFYTFGSSKEMFSEAWTRLSTQLNSLGPPVRDGSGWQKVWNDLKNKIKKKLGHNKKEISATGGGSNKLYVFSQLEESVISLLALEKTCSATNITFGLVRSTQEPSTSNNQQIMDVEEQTISNFTSAAVHQPVADDLCTSNVTPTQDIIQPTPATVNRRARSISINLQEERRQLLESQTTNIEKQTKIMEEQSKQIKECARYTRKLYELHEKQLKLFNENLQEKRKYRQNKMEYKIKELEYKERKLILQEKLNAKNTNNNSTP